MAELEVRFAGGTAVGFVGPRVAGLVAIDPRSDLFGQLWGLSSSGAGLDELLEVLAGTGVRQLPAFGLAAIEPGGVRVVVRGDVVADFDPVETGRVLTISGDRVHSWLEHVEEQAAAVHLHLSDDLSELGAFQATGGVFPAARLLVTTSSGAADQGVRSGAADASLAPTSPPAPAQPASTVLPVFDLEPEGDDGSEPAGSAEERPADAAATDEPTDEEVEPWEPSSGTELPDHGPVDFDGGGDESDPADGASAGAGTDVADERSGSEQVLDSGQGKDFSASATEGGSPSAHELSTDEAEGADAPVVLDEPVVEDESPSVGHAEWNKTLRPDPDLGRLVTDVVDDVEVLAEPPTVAPGAGVDALAGEPVDGLAAEDQDDSYDHLFGATQFRSVEDAAVREADSDDDDELPAGSRSAAVGADADGDGVFGLVPPPPAGPEGDHDGMTITLAELRARQAAAGAPQAPSPPGTPSGAVSLPPQPVVGGSTPPPVGAGGGVSQPTPAGMPGSGGPPPAPVQSAPLVHAVRCPEGHPNPPHMTACRVCGDPIADQEPVTVPRPVLGVLRFADGRNVELTGPLLMGRNPQLDGSAGADAPEFLVLASPLKEMSSSHLELRIEGWQVLAVDCHSTNGTVVQLPGREAQRLRPAEPFPIVPGTTVNLADEAEFVFEASS